MSETTQPVGALTRQLSEYIATALDRPLPDTVVEHAKHHILDTLAAMVSGAKLEPGRLAIKYVRSQGGRREALVAGSRVVTSAVNAALANGMLAHADETDDSHEPSRIHPGCGIIPGALAMAEREGRDGTAFLRAVVLGYDVGCRTTRALVPDSLTALHRSTHSRGPLFGATAAAAALARLDARRTRYALSYAAQQSSGITYGARDTEHVEKAFDFGGMGARNGVAAATMVAAGFTGIEDPFTGDRNFFLAESPAARPEEMVKGLGTHYEIAVTNIKKWSVGSPIQAAVDVLLQVMGTHRLAAEDIEAITVRLPEAGAATVDNRTMPDISLQHLMAVIALDGGLTFKSSHDYKRMGDPAVLAVRRRVTLVTDPELSVARPPRQGIVEVTTRDGRKLSYRQYAVRGTSDNPMTRKEVEDKALDIIGYAVGPQRARDLIARVWDIERMKDIRELRPYLQA